MKCHLFNINKCHFFISLNIEHFFFRFWGILGGLFAVGIIMIAVTYIICRFRSPNSCSKWNKLWIFFFAHIKFSCISISQILLFQHYLFVTNIHGFRECVDAQNQMIIKARKVTKILLVRIVVLDLSILKTLYFTN